MNSKSRSQSHKRFYRNLLSSLVLSGRVVTTKTRAKTLKSETQKFLGKLATSKDDLQKIKHLEGFLFGGAIDKASKEMSGKEVVRSYDYRNRSGDGALQTVVVIEKSKDTKESLKPKGSK
jgi:ribosomal protein L17